MLKFTDAAAYGAFERCKLVMVLLRNITHFNILGKCFIYILFYTLLFLLKNVSYNYIYYSIIVF